MNASNQHRAFSEAVDRSRSSAEIVNALEGLMKQRYGLQRAIMRKRKIRESERAAWLAECANEIGALKAAIEHFEREAASE